MPFVFAQACIPAVPVWGEKDRYFPVHRVYAIAGNYADHLAEMGRVERAEPVFFTKPSDGLVVCKEGKSVEIPYPRETNSFCLEVELVVAIGKTAPETGFISPEEAEEYNTRREEGIFDNAEVLFKGLMKTMPEWINEHSAAGDAIWDAACKEGERIFDEYQEFLKEP